jgi:hypothetical protein
MRSYRSTLLIFGIFTVAASTTVAAPPPDDFRPIPADEPTMAEKQIFVFDYLAKKTGGPAFPTELRKENAWSKCIDQYDAAKKAKNPQPLLYRLIQGHLKTAEARLKDQNIDVQREGVQIAMAAANCAADHLQDKWLAVAIVEAFVLPNVDLGNADESKYLGRVHILQNAIAVFRAVKDWKRLIKAYRLLIDEGTLGVDAARIHLAVALEEDGQLEEALKQILIVDPTGSEPGAVADIVPKLKEKIAKKAAENPPK